MRLIATIFAGLLLIAIVVAGYFASIMMTPVTPGNVESRLTGICQIGLNAFKLDQRDRIRTQKLGSFSCSCVAKKIIQENGPAAAARTANVFRKSVTAALRRMVTGDRANEKALADAGVSQSDFRQFSRVIERVDKKCDVTEIN